MECKKFENMRQCSRMIWCDKCPSLDKITNAICKNIACLNRAFQLLEKVHDEVNLREDGELEEKTICEISEYFESIIQEK